CGKSNGWGSETNTPPWKPTVMSAKRPICSIGNLPAEPSTRPRSGCGACVKAAIAATPNSSSSNRGFEPMALLYTKMKVFHFQDKLDSLPLESGRILPPLHIRIKPTNACNHNCWYCAYKAEGLQLGKDMDKRDRIPREKMLEIIADLAEMGVKAVTFSGGGDPFVYPHLLRS